MKTKLPGVLTGFFFIVFCFAASSYARVERPPAKEPVKKEPSRPVPSPTDASVTNTTPVASPVDTTGRPAPAKVEQAEPSAPANQPATPPAESAPLPAPAPTPEPPAPAPAPAPPPPPSQAGETPPSAPSEVYNGVFKSGNAPLKAKTRVQISRSGDAYVITPLAKKPVSSPWNVSLEKIRGAQVFEKGMWFYWFDSTENTLSANFEIEGDAGRLVGEINKAVTEFNTRNLFPGDEYRSRFETYRDKALKESK